jgi:hypothetical protein
MSCEIFMSYTSIKDLHGAVGFFRDHLEWELRQQTGNLSTTVFQDKRDIHGGEKWEEILTDRLAAAKLLLILLSPTWLTSTWCIREYKLFVAGDGAPESTVRPIVPLVWQDLSGISALTSEQEGILGELKTRHLLQWGELRYDDWKSPGPNKAAGKLAKEIALRLAGRCG